MILRRVNQPADHGGRNGEMNMQNQKAKNEALIGGSGLNAGLGVFDLQHELCGWAHDSNVLRANHLAKIRDELAELEAAPNDRMEMADVLLALMLHAEQNGVDLLLVGWQKLAIIKGRTYGDPDERGVIRHIDTPNV